MSKKNKQSKSVGVKILTPENYIRTKARTLPVAECLINKSWETNRMANVFISRRHVNGHYTFAIFLIDLACLGVKDVMYKFNVDESDYEGYVDDFKNIGDQFEPVDYNLAHNIVYGAENYANDLGIAPHEDWEIAQYILEADDENVPIIDIEFGKEGKPFYMVGPSDNVVKINTILRKLQEAVGEGNYVFVNPGAEWSNNDWDDEDDFDEDDDEYEDEDLSHDVITEIIEGKREPNLKQLYFVTFTSYLAKHPEVYKAISDVDISDDSIVDYELDNHYEDEYGLLDELQKLSATDNLSISELTAYERSIKPHQRHAAIYTALLGAYAQINVTPPAELMQLLEQNYNDYMPARCMKAIYWTEQGNMEAAYRELGESFNIEKAFSHIGFISYNDFIDFYNAVCFYAIRNDILPVALSAASLILPIVGEEGFEIVDHVIHELTGVLFRENNPEEFDQFMNNLAKEKE